MTQKLYEEALADARKVTELAENNAKNAVLEAVIPRIRQLIERELLNENETDDDLLVDDDVDMADVVVKPGVSVAVDGDEADALVIPDDEGKMTLDLDSMVVDDNVGNVVDFDSVDDDEEFELSLESAKSLKVLRSNVIKNMTEAKASIDEIKRTIRKYRSSNRLIRESKGFKDQIARTISKVDNIYEYVQENVEETSEKKKLQETLESLFKNLNTIQETAMSRYNRRNRRLHEEDETQVDVDMDVEDTDASDADGELTLKLTGLPDDVELDDVGVDLVVDDASDDEDVELDLDDVDDTQVDLDDSQSGDEELDLDVVDDENDDTQLESSHMSDDTVVEIDENMLRREIKRMARIRENAEEMDANGHGVDADVLDDFGDADVEGEPLDVVVTTETLKRKLALEARIQRRAKARALSVKAESRRLSGRRLQLARVRYNNLKQQYNESVARASRISRRLNEGANRVRRNVASQNRDVEKVNLRRKLAESNLHSVKLAYANKVLQNESLTKRQKAQVVAQLDKCKNSREAKLTYENVARVVGTRRPARSMNESRVLSSNPSRPAGKASSSQSQSLNEGFETDRWAKLAGISK